jgi:hypothetical protein
VVRRSGVRLFASVILIEYSGWGFKVANRLRDQYGKTLFIIFMLVFLVGIYFAVTGQVSSVHEIYRRHR